MFNADRSGVFKEGVVRVHLRRWLEDEDSWTLASATPSNSTARKQFERSGHRSCNTQLSWGSPVDPTADYMQSWRILRHSQIALPDSQITLRLTLGKRPAPFSSREPMVVQACGQYRRCHEAIERKRSQSSGGIHLRRRWRRTLRGRTNAAWNQPVTVEFALPRSA